MRRSDTIIVIVALTGLLVVLYEAKFHAWPGQSVPGGIDWCGTTYDRHGTIDVDEAFGGGARPTRLRLVKHAPPLPPRHPVYSRETAADVEREQAEGRQCGALYLRLSADRYVTYGPRSGG